MNVPNLLTSLRIVSIPALIIILLSHFKDSGLLAFVIFLLASFTDTIDGIWARRKNKITILGQLLDPIADKLLVTAALICLVELGAVPSWMAVIIIGREIAVTGFRAIASSKGYIIPASPLGKIKMILETVTISLLILGRAILGKLFLLAQVGLWLVVASALVSAVEYFIKYAPLLTSKRS